MTGINPSTPLMFLGPALGDKLQIEIRIGAVNFIAEHRMPNMREMHPQLMQPTRMRLQA